MTAMELNAELFRELSIIADDEAKMVDILREGEKEIAEGNFETIAIDDLWK